MSFKSNEIDSLIDLLIWCTGQKRKEKIAQLEARSKSVEQSSGITFDQSLQDGGVQLESIDLTPQGQDANSNQDGLLDVEEILRDNSGDMYPIIDLDANIDFSHDIGPSTLFTKLTKNY